MMYQSKGKAKASPELPHHTNLDRVHFEKNLFFFLLLFFSNLKLGFIYSPFLFLHIFDSLHCFYIFLYDQKNKISIIKE